MSAATFLFVATILTPIGAVAVGFIANNDKMARIETLLDAMNQRFEGVNRRFDDVDKRFEAVDTRFDGVDQRFNNIDKRLDRMGTRLDRIDHRVYSPMERDARTRERIATLEARYIRSA